MRGLGICIGAGYSLTCGGKQELWGERDVRGEEGEGEKQRDQELALGE